jgi:3-hydroxyacyl-CoA dehydrogenase
MGSGIAQVTAQAGMQVHLIDQTESLLDNAKTRIVDSLQRVAKKKYPDDKQVWILQWNLACGTPL